MCIDESVNSAPAIYEYFLRTNFIRTTRLNLVKNKTK